MHKPRLRNPEDRSGENYANDEADAQESQCNQRFAVSLEKRFEEGDKERGCQFSREAGNGRRDEQQ